MLNWNNKISNITQVALSQPKAYARACVINLPKDKREDGTIDFSHASTQYEVGDRLMFIKFDKWDRETFEQAGEDNVGVEFEVTQISGPGYYQLSGDPGEGMFFVVKMLYNDDPVNKLTEYIALVPITVEMIEKNHDKLRPLGLKQPGWYRYRRIEREEPLTPITYCELVISMKNFHSPDGEIATAGDTFVAVPDHGDPAEGMMVFKDNVGPEDDNDGSIILS